MRQQEYIQRLAEGDSTVMSDIYRDYGRALLGVAMQIVGDSERA